MKKEKFNKKIFRFGFGLILVIFGVLLINYSDYKELNVSCEDVHCYYNASFFEEYNVIETNLNYDERHDYGVLNSGDKLLFSNYEETPFLVENFFNIVVIILIICFLINYIWYKKKDKFDFIIKK